MTHVHVRACVLVCGCACMLVCGCVFVPVCRCVSVLMTIRQSAGLVAEDRRGHKRLTKVIPNNPYDSWPPVYGNHQTFLDEAL